MLTVIGIDYQTIAEMILYILVRDLNNERVYNFISFLRRISRQIKLSYKVIERIRYIFRITEAKGRIGYYVYLFILKAIIIDANI